MGLGVVVYSLLVGENWFKCIIINLKELIEECIKNLWLYFMD